jgi:hypothetical protein
MLPGVDRIRAALQAVGSALGDARRTVASVLERLPRWGLIVVVIAVVAIHGEVAFLIVQSGGDGGTSASEASLPCNDEEADSAVNADRFAQEVRDLGTVPPLSKVLEVYDAKVIACADLTGDGVGEMVLQLVARDVAPEELRDEPLPWAIYRVEEQQWTPASIRTHIPGAQLTVEDETVRESSTAFAEGDPLCCPTALRAGEILWDGERFTYKPDEGPRGRTIALADGEAGALAGFDLQAGSLPAAIAVFGPPTSRTPEGEVCTATWADLGLTIEFANLGGLDPCGPEGRIANLRVEGPEAELAGWQTQEGAAVGMAENELREMYPEIAPQEETTFVPEQPVGELFSLVTRPSSIGVDEVTPTLSARVDDGTVAGFELSVGAAGE